ncbi:MAG: CocE/NonD family hydrolase [Acidimicrobiales bacterium]
MKLDVISRLIERVVSLPAAADRSVTVERGVRFPVDDGVELMADVYTPAGAGPHPTILVRTPYGRGGPQGLLFGRVFAERGYRVVLQSCRGTFGSGGVFDPNFNERADGLATIRWIERQPWFDGRLAMNGPSYLGGVQWAVADDAGPSLRALCTHVTYSNITRHWYRGGSFSLEDAIEWTTLVSEQERGRLERIKGMFETRVRRIDRAINDLPIVQLDERVIGRRVSFWHDFVDHPTSEDAFWRPIDHSARLAGVKAPVLQVGGWYDIFLPIQLADYRTLVAAGSQPRLVVGPWTHTAPRGFFAQVNESLRWLDRHVLQSGDDDSADGPVRLFVMGADVWRDVASWPPPGYGAQPWHLHPGGRLAPDVPAGSNDSEPHAYTYDPADPTPVVGGTLLRRSGGRRDQARTEARADVAVFTSAVLTTDVEVVGEVTATIHVSSDLDHFDVFVRLCDVGADGRSYNVCDGIQRVSPLNSPRPVDGIWALVIELWPTAQRFRAGHRIRVQVSSGAHPRFVRNLGTAEPIATATTMRVAHQAIYHDQRHPSAIVLPVRTVLSRDASE